MTEATSKEVERLLLLISDVRERAGRTAKSLEQADAEEHVVDALKAAQRELERLQRALRQRTFYAVPRSELTLGV